MPELEQAHGCVGKYTAGLGQVRPTALPPDALLRLWGSPAEAGA
jgi:hypothetical protein